MFRARHDQEWRASCQIRSQWIAVCSAALMLGMISCTTERATESKQTSSPSTQSITLTVSAAASLQDALTEIGKTYQAQYPQTVIRHNFGASGSLQQQIEQGAPVDLFISAAEKQMDALAAKNLIDPTSRRSLARNQLVLIVPKQPQGKVTQFQDLVKPEVAKVAIGAPASVPAGQYAEETLKSLQLWEQVEPKTVQAQNVRQVLTYVELGNVNAGLVYKTDAQQSNQVQVVATAPPNSHRPITYPLAVVASTKHPQAAQAYANYLVSPTAKATLQKYGFSVDKPNTP